MTEKTIESCQQDNDYHSALPPVLYHYCSGETFVNIIKSGEIRLSHISTMNDDMEGAWFIKIWEETKRENPKVFTSHVFENKESVYKNSIHFSCFSENGDLKSQWCEYADSGKGFAIGFDTSFFNYPIWTPKCLTKGQKTTWCKIIYNEELQKNMLADMMKIVNSTPEGQGPISSLSIAQSYVHKNPSFIEEQEWRLVRASMQPPKDVTYRWTEFGISSYIEKDIQPVKQQFPIKEIVIGPKNLTTTDHLFKFLDNSGFTKWVINEQTGFMNRNVSIKKSNLTLR
jgi:hypothetical protein